MNHNETVQFFEDNSYFGANKENIIFFPQSSLPAIDENGKILRDSPSSIIMAPNGNGALFEAVN